MSRRPTLIAPIPEFRRDVPETKPGNFVWESDRWERRRQRLRTLRDLCLGAVLMWFLLMAVAYVKVLP